MDKSPSLANGASDTSHPHPTLSRESTTTITPNTDSQLSRKSTQTSAASSANPSPLPSREPSPTRPTHFQRPSTTRAASSNPGTRSRKNSQQDLSPSRSSTSKLNAPSTTTTTTKSLSSSNIPTLLPAPVDPNIKAPVPLKSPTALADQLRESPRWPVSPRLRSPPPILTKPNFAPPTNNKGEQQAQPAPAINVQRSSTSPQQPPAPESQSDTDPEELYLQSGMRTPARPAGATPTTLETVQEVSPFSSPKGNEDVEEKMEDSMISEASQPDTVDVPLSKSFVAKANIMVSESGSESGSVKAPRRSGNVSAPPLTRQSSTAMSSKLNGGKAKGADVPMQSIMVETETVTGIPSVPLAPVSGAQGSSTSLRTKPSSETIRPKKDKKKTTRKTPSMSAGTASSKADIFEAKVASAVEEANSSDSEETFVYDSNPPDRDRPQRFHSRTPSATSMVSQADRAGMRNIHSVLDNVGPPVVKKSMKFVNSYNSNGNANDIIAGDEDGKGTGRSHAGSTRGTARHHHHFPRLGRNVGNGHTSLFAEESPFAAPVSARSQFLGNNSRHSSGPPSPRFSNAARGAANGKRGSSNLTAGYDLDDTNGADDETTPLIPAGSLRSVRSGRGRRYGGNLRALEQQQHPRPYRSQPSMLNRFASCLVLTVMLLLVISGAIGFMFATSQPLQDIELVSMKNIVASEQELMLDLTVRAKNPNVVVVVVDSAKLEVFAKSPHAGTDSEWWRRPGQGKPPSDKKKDGSFWARRATVNTNAKRGSFVHIGDGLGDAPDAPDGPPDEKAPNMRLGTITEFDSPLSFEGSFFHDGVSLSTGEVRLIRPGNGTDGGSERWERILEDEFDLILKGVLRYTLPLSQQVRSVSISGRTTVKPNAANNPTLPPNATVTRGIV